MFYLLIVTSFIGGICLPMLMLIRPLLGTFWVFLNNYLVGLWSILPLQRLIQ